ncbi:outer membrane lipoprotein carrier protein LolA [Minwuia sp. IMCC3060]|uniref:LolA family protein n=1 Tax=Minwuia sp. IMCC3060 TaxID=3040675 RepID=UPI00247AFFC3|nr:outer membrane lipoprotein carrier protein LolA [Minwuia sp. IMCC3060]
MKSLVSLCLGAFLLIAGLLPAQALTEAEQKTVLQAQDWLQSVETLSARFVQVGGGGQAVGTMLLKRPGLIRFNYSPPAKVLLVSDGAFVSFIDYEVGQVSQWPLSQTPLSYLVPEQLDLMAEADIDQVTRTGGQVSFRLRDPDNPEQGTITLEFAEQPYRLTGWRVVDAQGQETAVALADIVTNIDLPLGSFTFRAPQRPWDNDR